jgi:eukaryotic-like serine/threonine-protein kinase
VGIILWEMLSGRRLFYGETDFDTVKQVQAAQIPSLRAENPAVPVELEKILSRALARDPQTRYATARDLGRELTGFLFRYGRPVTAYDIAEVVKSAVALRRTTQLDKSSIIDKLLEEALLEFTSLQDDKAAPATAGKASAGGVEPPKGFEDISNWADELGTAAPAPPVPSVHPPMQSYEEGNLAALEETDPKMPRVANAPASMAALLAMSVPDESSTPGGSSALAPSPSRSNDAEETEALVTASKGSSRMVALIVVAILALAVVGFLVFGRE